MKNFFANLTAIVCLFFSLSSHAQEINFWASVNQSFLPENLFQDKGKPANYKLFQLNENIFSSSLKNIHSDSLIISFPNTDGILERYNVIESSVMEPGLAARFRDIKTYTGKGIDDVSSTIHFDYSSQGFHGMILSLGKPTIYIDPLEKTTKYYIVSAKGVAGKTDKLNCLTEEVTNATLKGISPGTIFKNANDGKLRTFRLALACTGEYGKYLLDGTEKTLIQKKIKVLVSMITLLVRVNGIFERDFGIHFNLVVNNDVLIYLDPVTDPWDDELVITTHETIKSKIGNNYFDIGHLLSVTKPDDKIGGVGSGRICSTIKGAAYSSTTVPGSDGFVDIVCHELAHQFGASHTFTYKEEKGEIQWTHVETEAGRTIMGYSDYRYDYFHAVTIQEVSTYVRTLSCGVVKSIGNTSPVANAGSDYTIPKSTPFILTGIGTDANVPDVKSYAWEQMDIGTPATSKPTSTATSGPAFEVVPLSNSPKRMFPELSTVLSGLTSSNNEALPSVSRVLNFRFTVRDNHIGGGNNHSDDMKVNVTDKSGPFLITNPNTEGKIWTIGSLQNITWNVANTNMAPVSCANVKISLSIDGGLTFPIILTHSTPNDGTYSVVVPNKPTNIARIKVEAVGNIFFDISNKDFTIAPLPVPPCPDVYEPNNQQEDGKLIPVNINVFAKIFPLGDEDFFKFSTTNDAPGFKASLTNLPVDCDMIILDSNLDEIASSLNGGLENEIVEYNGSNKGATYYVLIFGIGDQSSNTNCYTLRVETNSIISLIGEQQSSAANERVSPQYKDFKIYPNPVKNNQLNIQFFSESKNAEQIVVADLTGKVLFKQPVNTYNGVNNLSIKLPELTKGLYIIRIGKQVAKLIIQ